MKNIYMLIVLLTLCFSLVFGQETDEEDKIEAKINSVNNTNGVTSFGDSIVFKDGTKDLIKIFSEGTGGSIMIPSGGFFGGTTNKLFNFGGDLYWSGIKLALEGGGVSSINDLLDARYDSDTKSLYLGEGAGITSLYGENTGLGYNALKLNEGHSNTAVGFSVLENNYDGVSNTAVGYFSMNSNTGGEANTAQGTWSLQNNLTGDGNTAIGFSALSFNTTGKNNTILGVNAGGFMNGDNNIVIGKEAGPNTESSGSNNIFIGSQAGISETGDYNLSIHAGSPSEPPLIAGRLIDLAVDEAKMVRVDGLFHSTRFITTPALNIGLGEEFIAESPLQVKGNASEFAGIMSAGTIRIISDNQYGSIVFDSPNNIDESTDFLRFGRIGVEGIDFGLTLNPNIIASKFFIQAANHRHLTMLRWGAFGFATENPTSIIDIGDDAVSENRGYNQLRLRKSYTPTSSTDPNGEIGDTAWDDDYFYIKTNAGWKRTTLSTW